MFPITVDPIVGYRKFTEESFRGAGIRIHIKMWKIAAGYINAYLMSFKKQIAGGEGLDNNFDYFISFQHDFLVPAFTIADAEYSVSNIHCISLGIICAGRVQVNQLNGKIGVRAIR